MIVNIDRKLAIVGKVERRQNYMLLSSFLNESSSYIPSKLRCKGSEFSVAPSDKLLLM